VTYNKGNKKHLIFDNINQSIARNRVGRRSQTYLDPQTFMDIINNHNDNTDNIHRTVTVKGEIKKNEGRYFLNC